MKNHKPWDKARIAKIKDFPTRQKLSEFMDKKENTKKLNPGEYYVGHRCLWTKKYSAYLAIPTAQEASRWMNKVKSKKGHHSE